MRWDYALGGLNNGKGSKEMVGKWYFESAAIRSCGAESVNVFRIAWWPCVWQWQQWWQSLLGSLDSLRSELSSLSTKESPAASKFSTTIFSASNLWSCLNSKWSRPFWWYWWISAIAANDCRATSNARMFAKKDFTSNDSFKNTLNEKFLQ